jgi:phage FluMu protein Com
MGYSIEQGTGLLRNDFYKGGFDMQDIKHKPGSKTIRCLHCGSTIIYFKGGWVHLDIKDFLTCPKAATPDEFYQAANKE